MVTGGSYTGKSGRGERAGARDREGDIRGSYTGKPGRGREGIRERDEYVPMQRTTRPTTMTSTSAATLVTMKTFCRRAVTLTL